MGDLMGKDIDTFLMRCSRYSRLLVSQFLIIPQGLYE